MFGRVPVLPLNTLLGPKMRYLGNDINILSLEAMKNMFEIVMWGSMVISIFSLKGNLSRGKHLLHLCRYIVVL